MPSPAHSSHRHQNKRLLQKAEQKTKILKISSYPIYCYTSIYTKQSTLLKLLFSKSCKLHPNHHLISPNNSHSKMQSGTKHCTHKLSDHPNFITFKTTAISKRYLESETVIPSFQTRQTGSPKPHRRLRNNTFTTASFGVDPFTSFKTTQDDR